MTLWAETARGAKTAENAATPSETRPAEIPRMIPKFPFGNVGPGRQADPGTASSGRNLF